MLKGNKIDLEILKANDLNWLVNGLDMVANECVFWPSDLTSITEIENRFNKGEFWSNDYSVMKIMDKSGAGIGMIKHFRPVKHWNSIELGFCLFEKIHYNKGFMTEAITLFSDYLFKSKQFTHQSICCVPENIGVVKASLNSGFIQEGHLKKVYFVNGEIKDLYIFGKTKN